MFDPRALPKKGMSIEDMKRVWCEENVKIAYEAYEQGLPLVSLPFVTGAPRLRRPGILYEWSDFELKEAMKCKQDILYFADNYIQLYRPDGTYGPIKLRPYQRRYLKLLQDNRFVVFVAARQVGKTVTSAIFLLWCMIFIPNYKTAVLGDKTATAIENVAKLKSMYELLPFFLKPGIITWNQRTVVMDNGSYIRSGPCNLATLVGVSMRMVYMDEWAIPEDKVTREVTEFVVPVISALNDGRIIMTSSPRGAHGIFYETYMKALMGKGPFKPFSVDWYEVPGRDEKWKEDQISILGERGFAQQYGNEFLNDGTEWLSADTMAYFNSLVLGSDYKRIQFFTDNERALMNLAKVEPLIMRSKYKTKTTKLPKVPLLMRLQLDSKAIDSLTDLQNKYIIFTIDTGEGKESDFTIANGWFVEIGDEQEDMIQHALEAEQAELELEAKQQADEFEDEDDMLDAMVDVDVDIDDDSLTNDYLLKHAIRCRQFMCLSSDEHAIPMVALFMELFIRYFCNPDRVKVVCELDGIGSKMQALLATDIVKNSSLELEQFGSCDGKNPGILMRGKNKRGYVYDTQQYLEDNRILPTYGATVYELGKFQEVKPGKYEGVDAHDDQSMSVVHLGGYMKSLDFQMFIEDMVEPEEVTEDEDNY